MRGESRKKGNKDFFTVFHKEKADKEYRKSAYSKITNKRDKGIEEVRNIDKI